MARIQIAGNILKPLGIKSVLDVGCRDGSLSDELPSVDYSGADLFPDKRGRVKFVGDFTAMEIPGRFDAVAACDILEHLPHPSAAFDRLAALADRYILVSLPNTYDLKIRCRFALQGRLGGKYTFTEEEPVDRHCWLVSRQEAISFYQYKAKKHGMRLDVLDMGYGASGGRSLTSFLGRFLSTVLPRSIATATVFGLFSRST